VVDCKGTHFEKAIILCPFEVGFHAFSMTQDDTIPLLSSSGTDIIRAAEIFYSLNYQIIHLYQQIIDKISINDTLS
jgi:hypothetical protein